MKPVARLGRSPTLWIGLTLIMSFWLWALPFEANYLIEWLRVTLAIFGITAVCAYLPGVYKFLTEPTPAYAQQLTMGIVIAATGAVGTAIWLLLWRLAGFPAWMVNTYTNAFLIWLSVIGYLMHISVGKAINNEVPTPNWWRVAFAVVVSAVVGYAVVIVQPDTSGFMEAIRPYVP